MLETKYIIMIVAFGVLVVYVLASIWLRNFKIQKKEKAPKPKKEKKSRQPLFKQTKSSRIHKIRIKKDKQAQEAKVEKVYQPSAQPIKVEDLVAEQDKQLEQSQPISKPVIADVVKEERAAAQKQSTSDAYVTDFDQLIARQRARRAEVARQREEMRKYFENRNNTGRTSAYTPLRPTVKSSLDVVEENVDVSVHPSTTTVSRTMTRADYEKVLQERKWGTDYSKFNQQTSTISDTDRLAESMMIGEVVAHAKSKNKKNTYFH